MSFRVGSVRNAWQSAGRRGYLNNRRTDEQNFRKVGFWASSGNMNLVIVNSWHSRVTDRKAVTNYCVTGRYGQNKSLSYKPIGLAVSSFKGDPEVKEAPLELSSTSGSSTSLSNTYTSTSTQ